MAYVGTSITQGATVRLVPAVGLLVVGPEAVLTALNPGADAVSAALDSQVVVIGTLISQYDDAIEATGADVSVTVYAGARLYGGDTGVTLTTDGLLLNAGEIAGDLYGVRAGSFAEISNTGTIRGAIGVLANGTIGFDNHGTILGDGKDGIAVQGSSLQIDNHGTLAALRAVVFGGDASNNAVENTGTIHGSIRGGAGNETIRNHGLIDGFISLGDDWDRYDGRLGTITEYVSGGAGADTLLGGAGAESLDGGDGEDTLHGGAGEDSLAGGAGADELLGGAGIDLLSYDFFAQGVILLGVTVDLATGAAWGGHAEGDVIGGFEQLRGTLVADSLAGAVGAESLWGGGGADTLAGDAGDDWLWGESGADSIEGGDGADVLLGGTEADRLAGGAGTDRLFGLAGADTLEGGAGRDFLTGGLDADVFRFAGLADSTVAAPGRDRVQDFRLGTDKVDLAAIDAKAGGADDAFAFIGTAAFSAAAGELRAATAGANTYVQGDVNGDGAADFSIEFAGSIRFLASAFVL
jgi:Ca2+-binding RTX toxin-like protein